MIFHKNKIFSLWIKNPAKTLNYQVWWSWVRLGYKVTIYSDRDLKKELPLKLAQQIEVKPVSSSLLNSAPSFVINQENLLQFTDLWRFKYLELFGGTWVDSDLLLKKRIPPDDIVISSEHTLQRGGRKSKENYRPNIGVLRFPPNNKFVSHIVSVLTPTTKEDENPNVNSTSKMMKFIKEIKKKKWAHVYAKVVPPEVYCPVPYPYAKELFTVNEVDLFGKEKYGLRADYTDEKTIGYHLWENLAFRKHKVDLDADVHENSIYNNLLEHF